MPILGDQRLPRLAEEQDEYVHIDRSQMGGHCGGSGHLCLGVSNSIVFSSLSTDMTLGCRTLVSWQVSDIEELGMEMSQAEASSQSWT